jgi:C4-dicarboxylate transporter DctM subunit
MMWQQLGAQTLELGWDFYGSRNPLRGARGACRAGLGRDRRIGDDPMLVWSGALPLSLLGESFSPASTPSR